MSNERTFEIPDTERTQQSVKRTAPLDRSNDLKSQPKYLKRPSELELFTSNLMPRSSNKPESKCLISHESSATVSESKQWSPPIPPLSHIFENVKYSSTPVNSDNHRSRAATSWVPSAAHVDQRVTVGGRKNGVLRYFGAVHFDAGLWCGVELDEPDGRHDGEVYGRRYFTCRYRHGVLAPLAKVRLATTQSPEEPPAPQAQDVSSPLPPQPRLIRADTYSVHSSGPCSLLSTRSPDCDDCQKDSVFPSINKVVTRTPSPPSPDAPVATSVGNENVTAVNTATSSVAAAGTASKSRNGPLREQGSLEMDESLGILTPDQMVDFTIYSESCCIRESVPIKAKMDQTENASQPLNVPPHVAVDRKADGVIPNPTDGHVDASKSEEYWLQELQEMHEECLLDQVSFPECDSMVNWLDGADSLADDDAIPASTPEVAHAMFTASRGAFLGPSPAAAPAELPAVATLGVDLSLSPADSVRADASDRTLSPEDLPVDTPLLDVAPVIGVLVHHDADDEVPKDNERGEDGEGDGDGGGEGRLEEIEGEEGDGDPDDEGVRDTTLTGSSSAGPSSRSSAAPLPPVPPPPSSFITSVTSITSLDNGYQGDGEWSRPASRGADQSPTGPAPVRPKAPPAAPDPMTDSDFFTESDADPHEEPAAPPVGNARRGDRHAQVIDGTLYGSGGGGGVNGNGGVLPTQQHQRCPSFTASVSEEMESSGVYSDLERRSDLEPPLPSASLPLPLVPKLSEESRPADGDFSPDGSTKTLSSQLSVKDFNKNGLASSGPASLDTAVPPDDGVDEDVVAQTPASVVTSPEVMMPTDITNVDKEPVAVINAVVTSGKNPLKEPVVKKHRMPKRNVTSKIKAMLEIPTVNRDGCGGENASTEDENQEKRRPTRSARRPGRWDAVLEKIAVGQAEEKLKPSRLKEVKCKVYAKMGPPAQPLPSANRRAGSTSNDQRKLALGPGLLKSWRRLRTTPPTTSLQQSSSALSPEDAPQQQSQQQVQQQAQQAAGKRAVSGASSAHSSLSDVSVGTGHPTVKASLATRASKKQRNADRSTSPLSDGSSNSATSRGQVRETTSTRPAGPYSGRERKQVKDGASPKSQKQQSRFLRTFSSGRGNERPRQGERGYVNKDKNGPNAADMKTPTVRKQSVRRGVCSPGQKPTPLRDHNRMTTNNETGNTIIKNSGESIKQQQQQPQEIQQHQEHEQQQRQLQHKQQQQQHQLPPPLATPQSILTSLPSLPNCPSSDILSNKEHDDFTVSNEILPPEKMDKIVDNDTQEQILKDHIASVQAQLKHVTLGFDALSVVLQHTWKTVEILDQKQLNYKILKQEWNNNNLLLEDMKGKVSNLETLLMEEKYRYNKAVASKREEITILKENFEHEKKKLTEDALNNVTILEKKYQDQIENLHTQYTAEQKHQHNLQAEREEKLLRDGHEREENARKKNEESMAQMHNEFLQQEQLLRLEMSQLKSDNDHMKNQLNIIMDSSNKDSRVQAATTRCAELEEEVRSLQSVLELRHQELQELRRNNGNLSRQAEQLPSALQRITALEARVEDLQAQLKEKNDYERHVTHQHHVLLEALQKEVKQKNRLSLLTEELQWKLKQNSEVVNALAAMNGTTTCIQVPSTSGASSPAIARRNTNGSLHAISESSPSVKSAEETEMVSSRIQALNNSAHQFLRSDVDDDTVSSPPPSPKIKGVVEKNDSVSWVLEMEESSEELVSRLVRRAGSFRGTTPPPPSSTPMSHAQTLPPPKRRYKSGSVSLPSPSAPVMKRSSSKTNDVSMGRGSMQSRSRSVSADSMDSVDFVTWELNVSDSYKGKISHHENSTTDDKLIITVKNVNTTKSCIPCHIREKVDVLHNDSSTGESPQHNPSNGNHKWNCDVPDFSNDESPTKSSSSSDCTSSDDCIHVTGDGNPTGVENYQTEKSHLQNVLQFNPLNICGSPNTADLSLLAACAAAQPALMPKDAAGEAMISEETSEDENDPDDDVVSSSVTRSASENEEEDEEDDEDQSSSESSGLDLHADALHGESAICDTQMPEDNFFMKCSHEREQSRGQCAQQIKANPLMDSNRENNQYHILMSDSGSLSTLTTTLDLSWSEDFEAVPSESEG